ncbi:hypothetical protein GCM10009738_84110 [Kitasatospora viridis]
MGSGGWGGGAQRRSVVLSGARWCVVLLGAARCEVKVAIPGYWLVYFAAPRQPSVGDRPLGCKGLVRSGDWWYRNDESPVGVIIGAVRFSGVLTGNQVSS